MFKNKLAFVLLCLVLIVTACGPSDETTTENKGDSGGKKAIKLTFTEPARLLSVAPLYVAIEQGFLKKKE